MPTNLQKIEDAVDDLKDKKFRSIRQAARAHDISHSKLAQRLRGRKPRVFTYSSLQRLNPTQEITLVRWLEDLQRQILPSNHATVRQIITYLLAENNDHKPLGKNWTTKFLKRHPQLATRPGQRMDINRLVALDTGIIQTFFSKFCELRTRYNVEDQDIYNMDEKGFQMGQTGSEPVIVNKCLGPPVIPSTGTSKWVTIIECISATGQVLKPMVIHIGKDVKDHWFPPTEHTPDWEFGFSTAGWTDDELALYWLRRIFIPQTYRPNKHRLLVLDGHHSHESGMFQYECLRNAISLVYLPSHASHVLQPLDVGPFSPLGGYYRKEVHNFTPTGFATFDRATFTKVYQLARPRAFTPSNIRAGWRRAGLQPVNIDRILQNPQVLNLLRATPELQPEPQSREVYTTPVKARDYQEVLALLEAKLSPISQRHLTKLDHGIHQTLTANQVLQNQVRQDRKVRIDAEIVKRTKRIQKQEDKRVWSLQEIKDARNPAIRRTVKIKRRRRPTKALIVTIPVPIRD
jgi:hypothetical protein